MQTEKSYSMCIYYITFVLVYVNGVARKNLGTNKTLYRQRNLAALKE